MLYSIRCRVVNRLVYFTSSIQVSSFQLGHWQVCTHFARTSLPIIEVVYADQGDPPALTSGDSAASVINCLSNFSSATLQRNGSPLFGACTYLLLLLPPSNCRFGGRITRFVLKLSMSREGCGAPALRLVQTGKRLTSVLPIMSLPMSAATSWLSAIHLGGRVSPTG